MTPGSDEPTARAQDIIDQVLALVRECRVVLRALEHPGKRGESQSARAERSVHFRLVSAIDDGLIRTMEDALRVLRHVSEPLGPMGAEWLERQARALGKEGD
jgi:hypothetical protein